MKKTTFILLLCLSFVITSFAQEGEDFRTVFPKRDKEKKSLRITGMGGPMMIFTSVGNDFAHLMGGGGAVLLNDFYFGGYGFGATNDIPYKNQEEEFDLQFGYGGIWTGYIFKPYSPVHIDVSAQIGGGSISQRIRGADYDTDEYGSESVFVLTPVVEVQFNFARLFRLGVGTSLNYVTGAGISNTAYTTKDFLKPAVYLSFKFGYFY